MKRIAYLSLMFIALTLMSFSCEKEDPQPEPDVITAQDIEGDWNFVSLEYNSVIYDTPEKLSALNVDKNYVTVNLLDVSATAMTLTLYDAYGVNLTGMSFSIADNELWLDSGALKFQIVNADTFNKTTLQLKLLTSNSSVPTGGTYTLSHAN